MSKNNMYLRVIGRIFVAALIFLTLFAPAFTGIAKARVEQKQTNMPLLASHNYYVNGKLGSDSNSGTQGKPWKTIQKAANVVRAGDTVTVLTGNYPERITVTRSGKAKAQITFKTKGKVITQGFTIRANYVTIRGFQITDTPDDGQDGYGIFVQGSNCIIENNYIHYATRGGIQLFAQAGSETLTANCVVRNNRLYRNTLVGILVQGRNHQIIGNEIWGTIQYHPKWLNPPIWADADGIHFHGSGHVFRKNYIHDILFGIPENINPHIDCFQTFSSSNKEAASNILFEQNRCDNARVQSSDEFGKGFMLENALNITIRNNIIKAYAGINASQSKKLLIYNNTFTSNVTLTTSYDPVGITFTNVPNSIIKNNIFYNLPGHIIYLPDLVSRTSLISGKNLVYRSDGKPLWTTNTYSHVNDLWGVNPKIVSQTNYHLRAGSPSIDAGYVVPVPNDFDGKVRPQGLGYDIGAYEFPQP